MKHILLLVGIGLGLSLLLMAYGVRVGLSEREPPAPPVATAVPAGRDPGPLEVDAHPVGGTDLELLRSRSLALPVEGLKAADLRDDFAEARGDHPHEALDILAPRGTRVLAADDGRVVKLFKSVSGGLTVYQFDPTETFCYYYAHLDAYAAGLSEGDYLTRGSVVGFVGTSGNAPRDTPHLHFAVFKLGPGKRWWEGTPIDPFPIWAVPG